MTEGYVHFIITWLGNKRKPPLLGDPHISQRVAPSAVISSESVGRAGYHNEATTLLPAKQLIGVLVLTADQRARAIRFQGLHADVTASFVTLILHNDSPLNHHIY